MHMQLKKILSGVAFLKLHLVQLEPYPYIYNPLSFNFSVKMSIKSILIWESRNVKAIQMQNTFLNTQNTQNHYHI